VSDLKKYKIDIFNIPFGVHEYAFDFNSEFFENFENSLIEKGQGEITVALNKSDTFLELNFQIIGNFELICDRSLDPFEYPVHISRGLILKYAGSGPEDSNESNDEITYITWGTQSIELAQYIYEFLSLEVPLKKLHPRYGQEEAGNDQDEELVYSSVNNNKNETEVDPRWQKLKSISGNNKG